MKRKYIAILAGIIVAISSFYFAPQTFIAFIVGWVFFPPIAFIIYMARCGVQECKASRTVTKNVSLNEEYIKKLESSTEKYNGNLSAAIRYIINQRTKSCSISDNFIFRWMMIEVEDTLIPDDILNEMINPQLIDSMEDLEKYVKDAFIEWNIDISLMYDMNTCPSNVMINVRGNDQKIKLAASLISQFLVKNSYNIHLKIININNSDRQIKVELLRSSCREDAIESLFNFFGKTDKIMKTIKDKPDFWKSLINTYISNDYNMVMIHRNHFEDLFSNKTPMGEIPIESMAKKPVCDIPLVEMFDLIKKVNEASGVIDRVEVEGQNLILFHNYRNKDAIDRLKNSFISLLRANGHLYEAKLASNMILLNKINGQTENVENIEIFKIDTKDKNYGYDNNI